MKLLRNSEMAAEGYLAVMKNFREFAAYGFAANPRLFLLQATEPLRKLLQHIVVELLVGNVV